MVFCLVLEIISLEKTCLKTKHYKNRDSEPRGSFMPGESLTSAPHHPLFAVAINFDHYLLLIYHNYLFSFIGDYRFKFGISRAGFTNISTCDMSCFKFSFYVGILNPFLKMIRILKYKKIYSRE